MATMEEVLVPLFLHHRYQVDATASALGGVYHTYGLRGEAKDPVQPVPSAEQRAAIDALTSTLKPSELVLPRNVLETLPPRPFGFPRHRELFPRYTGMVFDPVAPAVVAADLTISTILQPERAARLVAQHALDPSMIDLKDVLDRLQNATFDAPATNPYEAEVSRAIERVFVDRLIGLASAAEMPQVRAVAERKLADLANRLQTVVSGQGDESDIAHSALVYSDIKRFLDRTMDPVRQPAAPAPPPGAPIGEPAQTWLEYLEPPCSWYPRPWSPLN
jgi:hypothetical protein